MSDHRGELEESGYGFICWTTCICGWRSRGYPSSAQAWIAFDTHQRLRAEDA